jgi:hypothetical protein
LSTDPDPALFRPPLEPDESVLLTVSMAPPTAPETEPPPPPPLPPPPEPPTFTPVDPALIVTSGSDPVADPPPPLEPLETGGVVTFVVVEGTVTDGVVATGVVTAGTVADGVVTVVVVPGRLSAIAVAAPAAESAVVKMTAAAIRRPWDMRQRATSPAKRRNLRIRR